MSWRTWVALLGLCLVTVGACSGKSSEKDEIASGGSNASGNGGTHAASMGGAGGTSPSGAGQAGEAGQDDTSTTRETAFAKIRARLAGTALAAEILGGG